MIRLDDIYIILKNTHVRSFVLRAIYIFFTFFIRVLLLGGFWSAAAARRHVDLSSNERGGVSATAANDLIAMLTTDGGGRCAYGESEVCLRGDKLFAPRLQQGRCVCVSVYMYLCRCLMCILYLCSCYDTLYFDTLLVVRCIAVFWFSSVCFYVG